MQWKSAISILGLTETWICPEDSTTPAVLSNNFPFSPMPQSGWKGTGLLISNNWKYSTHYYLCIKKHFNFSMDDSLIVVFGDFEIHLGKPYTADFHFHS